MLVDDHRRAAASHSPRPARPTALRHRLWAITDPDELSAIAADLAPRHRADRRRPPPVRGVPSAAGPAAAGWRGAGPWDCGLALLVDSTAYPPQLGAIHRVVTGLVPEAAARLAAGAFTVRELPGGTADVRAALAALDDACTRGSRRVPAGGDGRVYLLTDPDPRQVSVAVPDYPAELWQQLPAAVLEGLLFARIWAIEDDARSVRAIHDAAEAIKAADAEPAGTAIICGADVGDPGLRGRRAGAAGAAQVDLVRAEAAHRPGHEAVR